MRLSLVGMMDRNHLSVYSGQVKKVRYPLEADSIVSCGFRNGEVISVPSHPHTFPRWYG